MENTRNLLNGGKSNLVNGLMAVLILSLIVLGCTCNQDDPFDFGSNDKKSSDNRNDEDKDDKKDDKDKKVSADFEADDDDVPTTAQSEALVKETLLDFNEAIKDKDFSDFHDNVAKSWKRTSKPADFEKGFKEFIEKKININMIEGENPDFSPKPYIDKKYSKKVLFLKGTYDTSPVPVNFDLEYIVDDDKWKLVFIRVDTRKK